jgi:diguanylate cyclase (GGDEF)-like protein
MKFLSIFSPRARARAEAEAIGEAPVEGAVRAARLFGIPIHQLTPQVRAAFNAMFGEIELLREEADQLKVDLAGAESAADNDALVAVYNRRAFMREAGRISAMVRRHEVEASLIYFDLNTFKEVNDLHGHAAGDSVLRSVGEVLLKQTRETDLVGRIGGDEFAVLLTHVTPEAARNKAEQLGAAIRTDRVLFDGHALFVSAAIGVADVSPDETIEQTLARADEAMYADKRRDERARA